MTAVHRGGSLFSTTATRLLTAAWHEGCTDGVRPELRLQGPGSYHRRGRAQKMRLRVRAESETPEELRKGSGQGGQGRGRQNQVGVGRTQKCYGLALT